jgi:hypothetical protein
MPAIMSVVLMAHPSAISPTARAATIGQALGP